LNLGEIHLGEALEELAIKISNKLSIPNEIKNLDHDSLEVFNI
jgi:hypothetical protein